MTKVVKRIILGLLGLIVIFILIMTWFYPFSPFSVYKSYSYTPDSYLVDESVKDLNDFKKFYGQHSKDDVAPVRTESVLEIYEQDWLVHKDSVTMNQDELDSILFKVKNARENLLNLTVQDHFTDEQRQYLLDNIRNLLSMEELIDSIKNNKWESRSRLDTEFHNFQMTFNSSFNIFKTFYEISQNK